MVIERGRREREREREGERRRLGPKVARGQGFHPPSMGPMAARGQGSHPGLESGIEYQYSSTGVGIDE